MARTRFRRLPERDDAEQSRRFTIGATAWASPGRALARYIDAFTIRPEFATLICSERVFFVKHSEGLNWIERNYPCPSASGQNALWVSTKYRCDPAVKALPNSVVNSAVPRYWSAADADVNFYWLSETCGATVSPPKPSLRVLFLKPSLAVKTSPTMAGRLFQALTTPPHQTQGRLKRPFTIEPGLTVQFAGMSAVTCRPRRPSKLTRSSALSLAKRFLTLGRSLSPLPRYPEGDVPNFSQTLLPTYITNERNPNVSSVLCPCRPTLNAENK
ncbi:protein of unknown function [Methylocaldum szegediense]|uniref:Uncharacterized protein n=1 Tax=Methylocaldum szegediense TaxID=73780 RepID=A0ABM9I4Q6_9GAMM|nr:protein of unknown function [Methylocaldum szegediense]